MQALRQNDVLEIAVLFRSRWRWARRSGGASGDLAIPRRGGQFHSCEEIEAIAKERDDWYGIKR